MLRTITASHRRRALAMAAASSLLLCGPLAAAAPGALASPRSPANSPTGGPAFEPLSVTFVSLYAGWALGSVACPTAGSCLALRETTDGGHNWLPRAVPASLAAAVDRKFNSYPVLSNPGQLDVRFADPRDGWIFGWLPASEGQPAALWSTHDGGATWHEPALPRGFNRQGPVFDLEAARGTAYMLGWASASPGAAVASSPVGVDRWHVDPAPPLSFPAGGAEPSGAIVLQGGRGWLVEGNDRGVTGSAQLAKAGNWARWGPPCQNVGDSYIVPAAATAKDLFAACVMGGFASPLSKSAPPGAKLGSAWLYVSGDGGRTFSALSELGPNGSGFFDLLASPRPGAVLVARTGPAQQLLASYDGGHHWSVVYQGEVFYLGFTSPMQGVALVQAGASTRMIMSFDAGRDWSLVHF